MDYFHIALGKIILRRFYNRINGIHHYTEIIKSSNIILIICIMMFHLVGNKMLTQTKADALINLPKKNNSNESYNFPFPGDFLSIPIISLDEQEKFLLDINRGNIRLSKCTYQERYQQSIILIRLDVDGPPHSNPEVETIPFPFLEDYNGQIVDCPHIHLYIEGYMDKWAIPISSSDFSDTKSLYKTLEDFFRYCNVVEPPKICWRQTLNEFE